MDYVVTAELEPPVEATAMDALQQEGVAALLDRQLALVEGVSGPEDDDIDVLDYRINVHPDRASVVLVLDAPSLMSAESAAATVLDELLGEIELLTGWTVAESEVRITEDEFNQSLAAADDASGETAGDTALEAAIEEALESSDESEPALDTEHWRKKLAESAPQLRAFDLGAFSHEEGGDAEEAQLAAGALIHAVRVVTDEIFYDELALAINNASVRDAVGLLVLEELPPCYDHRYDSLFARALLLSSAAVAARLAGPEWTAPRCTAECLALHLFINEAQVLLEAADLMEWSQSTPLFNAFLQRAVHDREYERLFELDFDAEDEADLTRLDGELRSRGLAFDQWFLPRTTDTGAAGGLHPYLQSL
ncbi:hypothetical protein [Parasphingorhabdus pacifica]